MGRVVSGIGAAGILTISIILVLEFSGKERRGLLVGLVNAGYTSGVALGAVVAGALLPITGWRALFWMQTPFVLLAGTAVFFSIPKSFASGPQSSDTETIRQKLAKIDYVGAVTLVMRYSLCCDVKTIADYILRPHLLYYFSMAWPPPKSSGCQYSFRHSRSLCSS